MANYQRLGFMYHSMANGSAPPAAIPRQVATTYATALYPGDPVALVSDGSVAQAAAGGGTAIFGVMSHVVQYRNTDGVLVRNGRYLPASTSYTADRERSMIAVIPCLPGVLFEVDGDDGSSIVTIANQRAAVGENCDHVYTSATADTGLGLGSALLKISTHAVTATLQWRIVDILDQPGNDPTVTHVRYLVACNTTGTQWAGTPALASIGVGI